MVESSRKASSELSSLSRDQVEASFLRSCELGRRNAVKKLLKLRGDDISSFLVRRAFKSAVNDGRYKIVDTILECSPDSLTREDLIYSVKRAVINQDYDLLKALSKDDRFPDVINHEASESQHVIMYAIDKSEEWFLELLIDLPELHVDKKHLVYAELRKNAKASAMIRDKINRYNRKEHHQKQNVIEYTLSKQYERSHIGNEIERRKYHGGKSQDVAV